MNKKFAVLVFLMILYCSGHSQEPLPDSTHYRNLPAGTWVLNNWIPNNAPEQKTGVPMQTENNDWKFILSLFLLVLFGLFKRLFPEYIRDLFALVFKSSVKSSQIKEQLQGKLLASVLLNLVFTMLAAIFAYQVIIYYDPPMEKHKLLVISTSFVFVLFIYLIKYITLLFFGWVFNEMEPASEYIFYVFYFNKIIGILLLPVVVLMLLNSGISKLIIPVSLFVISLLILYRYIYSYISIRKSSHLQPFQFFLYLCTLELLPFILLIKGLVVNYSKFV
jgi:hypothetical protein